MAHVAVTATLPVLDCLWLEKVTHTHAKNKFNTLKRSQPHIPAKEARASFPFQLFTRTHGGQHGEGKSPHHRQPQCSLKQNLKETDQPTQLRRTCHSHPSLLQTRRAQNPNQPRLLSTSYNSWHSMSRAMWQHKATFTTSQCCRNRANCRRIHVARATICCISILVRCTFDCSPA